jgi:hypothetical protein
MIAASTSGKESFSSTIRGLSHKKRSGVLQLDCDDTSINICFREGRIVEVESRGLSGSIDICDKLFQGGYLKEQVLGVVRETPISIRQLGQVLVEKGYLGKEVFVQAKGAYEAELLHQTFGNGYSDFNFTPKLINDDGALALNLWPTQFVLDAIEYSADRSRFEETFGGFVDSDFRVMQLDSEDRPPLSVEEERVLSLCEQEISPLEIYEKSLLSKDRVQLALLTLLDQELVEVFTLSDSDQSLFPNAANLDGESYPEANEESVLYGLVESAAEKLQEIQDREFLEQAAELDRYNEESDSFAASSKGVFEDELLPEQDEVEPLPLVGIELDDEPSERHSVAAVDALSGEVAAGIGGSQKGISPGVAVAQRRKSSEKTSLNKLLLQDDMTQRIVMGVTLAFLLSFAFIGADLLESWFAALSEFTSNT